MQSSCPSPKILSMNRTTLHPLLVNSSWIIPRCSYPNAMKTSRSDRARFLCSVLRTYTLNVYFISYWSVSLISSRRWVSLTNAPSYRSELVTFTLALEANYSVSFMSKCCRSIITSLPKVSGFPPLYLNTIKLGSS